MIIANRYIRILIATICVFLSMAVIAYALAGAYTNRGDAYNHKGQYDRAIEDYNKAIQLNPNLAVAYNNRGVAYADKGQYGKAISDFQKACDMGHADGCEALQRILE
jgi:tetratricopeptide (TPR) repeat protein